MTEQDYAQFWMPADWEIQTCSNSGVASGEIIRFNKDASGNKWIGRHQSDGTFIESWSNDCECQNADPLNPTLQTLHAVHGAQHYKIDLNGTQMVCELIQMGLEPVQMDAPESASPETPLGSFTAGGWLFSLSLGLLLGALAGILAGAEVGEVAATVFVAGVTTALISTGLAFIKGVDTSGGWTAEEGGRP